MGGADHAPVIDAVRNTLTDARLDRAFIAEAVLAAVGQLHRRPDGGGRSRGDLPRARGAAPRSGQGARRANGAPRTKAAWPTVSNIRRRPRARGGCKHRIARLYRGERRGRCRRRWPSTSSSGADNMTDRQGALTTLVNGDSHAARGGARQHSTSAIPATRWCSTNGSRPRRCRRATTLRRWSSELAAHRDFTLRQSQPRAFAGRRIQRQPARLPRSRRAAAIASSPTS